MLLNYTLNKNIVIEARESCRVPVPVDRCPLFRHQQQNEMTDDEKNQASKRLRAVKLSFQINWNCLFIF